MSYVIKIQKGCWIAPWDGDPGRTLVFESAKIFRSLGAATRAKNKIIAENTHRKMNLEILDYGTAKKEVGQ